VVQIAIEVILVEGPRYVVLETWSNGNQVRIPMGQGERVLDFQDVRTNWDAWVHDLINDANIPILTHTELRQRHPEVNINSELDATVSREDFMDQMGF
jgi:hypothetical protein